MLAIRSQASALSMVFSKSLARRLFRPSQAKDRSTTYRPAGPPDTDHCCGPAEKQSCLLEPIKEAVPAVEAPTIVLP